MFSSVCVCVWKTFMSKYLYRWFWGWFEHIIHHVSSVRLHSRFAIWKFEELLNFWLVSFFVWGFRRRMGLSDWDDAIHWFYKSTPFSTTPSSTAATLWQVCQLLSLSLYHPLDVKHLVVSLIAEYLLVSLNVFFCSSSSSLYFDFFTMTRYSFRSFAAILVLFVLLLFSDFLLICCFWRIFSCAPLNKI